MAMSTTSVDMPEEVTRVNVRRRNDPLVEAIAGKVRASLGVDLDADLKRARRLAELLDSRFSVGGVRFGLDAIVGLVPGVGDAVTTLAGLYPIWVAQRHGVGKWVRARMLANLVVDFLVGSVPVVGDLFDAGFKANLKNVELLEKALAKGG